MDTTKKEKFIGIDLHSNRFNICILSEDTKEENRKFELNSDELLKFYRILDSQTYVIIEASTNTFAFTDLIKDKVKKVFVANTHKLKLISMANRKTDKVDALKLAKFLKIQIISKEKLIPEVHIPSQTIRELRSLFTSKRLIRKQIGSIKNRIHSILKQNLHPFTKQYIFGKKNKESLLQLEMPKNEKFQLELLLDIIETYEKKIKEIDTKIKIAGQGYFKEIKILTSIRGISVITALALIADISDIGRFSNSKNLASYLRSTPKVDSSNETNKSLSTNKFGRKLSITLLSQSLNHFRDGNPKLNKWYTKKYTHKAAGKIRMAILRKVITEIYQMLKKKEYHYFRENQKHKVKIKEYLKLLVKNT